MMNRVAKICTACAVTMGLAMGLSACDDNSSKGKEQAAKDKTYDRQVATQPAKQMEYSPTREAINEWIETWGKRGKLSYVYVQNGQGDYGYFIMKGLPVPRCKMLTPTEKVDSGENGKVTVTQPGMDGTYSSGSTCNSYFGYDATTGAYMEFTVGNNQSYFLYDQPMTLPEFSSAKPMGPSKIKP